MENIYKKTEEIAVGTTTHGDMIEKVDGHYRKNRNGDLVWVKGYERKHKSIKPSNDKVRNEFQKYRLKMVIDSNSSFKEKGNIDYRMTSSDDAKRFGITYLELHEEPEEILTVVCFNTQNYVSAVFEVSRGSVDEAMVSIRELFKRVLLANAKSIMLYHNHPSGNVTPSRADIMVTGKVKEVCDTLDIKFLDHLIIGSSKETYSFMENTV